MRYVLIGVAVLAGLFALGWASGYNNLLYTRYFAPRHEAVRREVIEESKAYNQGMVQNLRQMQAEYNRADMTGKAALASTIVHQSADYDEERLPQDLRRFIACLRTHVGQTFDCSPSVAQ
jgi:hypothetical protein